jgi:type I restriction enzyme S subunit
MLTPSQKIEPRFFRYLFKSQRYIQALQSTTNLVRDGQALRFENFTLLDLPYLQSEEQLAIADFLDSELGKIDALVEEQRRLIELLKEKRQAVISHAVTKGLNPNTSMKDSGIEWLGPVPAHWHVKPLKFLIGRNGLIRGPFGGDLKKEIFQESGIKIYEQKNAIYRDAHLGDSYISESKFADMARFRVSEGDYIMSCSGTIGKAFRLPEGAPTGIINQALLIIRFSDCLCYQFANWVFESSFFTEQILDNSQGGAMKNLVGLGVFTSIALPVPPITEQQSIGCHLSTKAAKLDALIVEATHAIDLLQERRTALISAAVTGKIDVRGLATEEAA